MLINTHSWTSCTAQVPYLREVDESAIHENEISFSILNPYSSQNLCKGGGRGLE